MKTYEMKDLGYQRTPCELGYHVEVGKRVFQVPAQIIIDSRDTHYKDEQEDTWGFIVEGSLDRFEIRDWASNNMNWSEVAPYAVEIPVDPDEDDEDEFQEAWINGNYTLCQPLKTCDNPPAKGS